MTTSAEHLEYQRHYFERPEGANARLTHTESPYVQRHLDRVIAHAQLAPGQRILEVGAGMGRFTTLLLDRGLDVVASDLSDALLAELRAKHPAAKTLACDVAEVDRFAQDGFDRIIGFFMLHHLTGLREVFASLRRALRPGGRVAFCEPNAYCGLYYLQIAFSRQMTWRGDGGVLQMRPGVVLEEMRAAGFDELATTRYGFTPPALYNRAAGRTLDHALEKLTLLEPVRAFQIFSGRV